MINYLKRYFNLWSYYNYWTFVKNVLIIVNRGVDAENDLFLDKASKIVSIQFADFPDFKATWLVKATWVNVTLLGAKSKVKKYFFFLDFQPFWSNIVIFYNHITRMNDHILFGVIIPYLSYLYFKRFSWKTDSYKKKLDAILTKKAFNILFLLSKIDESH